MKFNRRNFLKKSSLLPLVGGAVPQLLTKQANAQSLEARPSVMLTRISHGGLRASDYLGNIEWSQEHQITETYKIRSAQLSEHISRNGNQISPVIGPEFNPYLSKISIASHLSAIPYLHNHNYGGCNGVAVACAGFLGENQNYFKARKSLDQVLVESIGAENIPYGGVLNIADRQADPNIRGMSYLLDETNTTLGIKEVDSIRNDAILYNSLFGQFDGSGGDVNTARSLVYESTLNQLARLTSSSRISTLNRAQLEIYQDIVRRVQRRVESELSCTAPSSEPASTFRACDNYPALAEMLGLSLACGQNRVICYSATNPGCEPYGNGGGGSYGIHTWVHQKDFDPLRDTWRVFFRDFVLPLVQLLDSVPMADGSLLDYTPLVFYTENTGPHFNVGHNVVVIGGNAYLQGGQIVSYANAMPGQMQPVFGNLNSEFDFYNLPGAYLNNWFETLLSIFEVPDSIADNGRETGWGFGDAWLNSPSNRGELLFNSWASLKQLYDRIYEGEGFSKKSPLPLLLR